MPLLIDQKHTSLVVTISVSICKRVECLVEELLPGVEVDAVPEAVLQVLGELPPHEAGVPVGDVGFFWSTAMMTLPRLARDLLMF